MTKFIKIPVYLFPTSTPQEAKEYPTKYIRINTSNIRFYESVREDDIQAWGKKGLEVSKQNASIMTVDGLTPGANNSMLAVALPVEKLDYLLLNYEV